MVLYHVWVCFGNGVSIVREVLRRSVVQTKRFRKDKTMKRKIMALGAVLAWVCGVFGATHEGVQLWENGPLWAKTNVGANSPTEAGYYFWWGDTLGYKWQNSKWVASDGSVNNFSFSTANCPTYGKSLAQLQSMGEEGAADSMTNTVLRGFTLRNGHSALDGGGALGGTVCCDHGV